MRRRPLTRARAASAEDLIRESARRFTAARLVYGHGTHSPQEEAAWLVQSTLGLTPGASAQALTRPVTARDARRVRALVARRIRARKPTAYLLKEAWLGPHRFYVDERVIVPRSHIAELLLEQLAPWVAEPHRVRRVLDLCTGSGCLAILAAFAFPEAAVDASELSSDALAVARINVRRYHLSRRVRLLHADLFDGLPRARYDLILSNPPYVRRAVMQKLPPEYRYEPTLALSGGSDGLDIVQAILRQARAWLRPGGLLVVETGNARHRVERTFPRVALTWAEMSAGGDVLIADRDQLPACPGA